MTALDDEVADIFDQSYPDEIEMGNKFRRAQADSPQGVQPQVKFEPLTVRRAICHALTQNYQDEQGIAAGMKLARGALCARFIREETPELDEPEEALAVQMVAKLYTPLIVHQVVETLQAECHIKELAQN